MTSQTSTSSRLAPQMAVAPAIALITPKEAAKLLRVSLSWLAKARMRGEGPPYIKLGRSIRYSQDALLFWTKSQQQLSSGNHPILAAPTEPAAEPQGPSAFCS
jgi:predicted DNA-binding transcriptional regulator AlpA